MDTRLQRFIGDLNRIYREERPRALATPPVTFVREEVGLLLGAVAALGGVLAFIVPSARRAATSGAGSTRSRRAWSRTRYERRRSPVTRCPE